MQGKCPALLLDPNPLLSAKSCQKMNLGSKRRDNFFSWLVPGRAKLALPLICLTGFTKLGP